MAQFDGSPGGRIGHAGVEFINENGGGQGPAGVELIDGNGKGLKASLKGQKNSKFVGVARG